MRSWLSVGVLLAAGIGSASGQDAGSDAYAELRAPAMAAYEAGETQRAYTLFEGVFAQIPDADPAERAATAFSLGILAHQLEDHARALEWLERGFALHEVAGTAPETYAQYVAYAGMVSAESGEPDLAIAYFRRAVEQGPHGEDTLEWRASTLNQLANSLHAAERYGEASDSRRASLAAYTQVYGPDHAYVGVVLEGLGEDVLADGHEAQAIDARREALRIALATREAGDLTIVTLAGTLASQLAAQEDTDGLGRMADLVEAHTRNDRHRARILSEIANHARVAGLTGISADLNIRAHEAAAADPQTPPEFLAIYLLNHATGVQDVSGYAAALPLLEQHYQMVRVHDGEPGLRTAAASERVWTALFRLSRFAEAEANARERLEALEARADNPATEIARAYENLALSIHEQYRPTEAGPVFARALEVLEQTDRGEHIRASLLDAYAIHLVFNGDRDEALAIARRNMDLRGEVYGSDTPSYARGLYTLAVVQRRLSMNDAALGSLAAAQAIYEAAGPNEAAGLFTVLYQRAELMLEAGDLAGAEALLASAEAVIPAGRPDQRRDWHELSGRILRSQGRLSEALGHYRESLAMRVAQDGPQGRSTVFPLLSIAATLRMQGQAAEAEPVVRRVLETHAAYGVTTGSDVGAAWLELATILNLLGREDEAREAASRSHALLADVWPRGTHRRAIADYNRGHVALLQHDYRGAEPFMRDAIEDMRQAPGRSDIHLGIMLNSWGYLNERLGQYRQAAAAYREGLALREGRLSNDNPALASGRAFLARTLIDHLGEPQEGLNLFRQASGGLIEGIVLRAGTAADDGVDGIEFARKDAFFTAHLEALWTNAQLDH
ncbi:MAG: tetratricopeptide repeat protein [Glycocaulis sp.]